MGGAVRRHGGACLRPDGDAVGRGVGRAGVCGTGPGPRHVAGGVRWRRIDRRDRRVVPGARADYRRGAGEGADAVSRAGGGGGGGSRAAWWPTRAARRRSRRCYRGPTGRRRENTSGSWFAEPTPRRWTCRKSPQPPHVLQGPIDENRFTIDGVALDEAPGAAVAGGTAMIAQHEVLAGRDAVFFPGDAIVIVLGDVVFD